MHQHHIRRLFYTIPAIFESPFFDFLKLFLFSRLRILLE